MPPSRSINRLILASTGIVMASVLLSRFLGFFRDWTVAQRIGSNAATDAYYAAFTLPDFLNYLVAGGLLSVTFIPVLARCIAEKREEEGWHVFSTVLTCMAAVLIAGILAGEILAPQLVRAIAPGFRGMERGRVIFLTRLMLPAQLFFCLGGILSAVQYAKARFVLPSLAPVIYNACIILGGVLLSARIGITGFAVGVVVGAFLGNFGLQVYGARRMGARFHPNLDFRNRDLKLFLKLSVPMMLALSIVYTDDWIIRWFGSYLAPASISWLSYAKTLMRVPQGLLAQAAGVASFPFLAQLYSERRYKELNQTLSVTLKGVILFIVPISALFVVQRAPLIYLVFSHTRLRGPDLAATAQALGMFSIAMFAWGAQSILARGFYAAQDTLTPAVTGTAITLVSLPVYWELAKHWQYLGLALASALAISSYAIALFILLSRRTHSTEAGGLLGFFFKIAAVSVAAGWIASRVLASLESRIAWRSTHGAFIVLAGATSAGLLAAVVLAKLIRIREIDGPLRRIGLG
jgi:putative peptidoglycan lipid II flippase